MGGLTLIIRLSFFFFTFNGLQCWRAKATIHSYRIKRFSGQACSPFHVRDTRIGLNTRYSAQRVSISSDDCRIAVDCKLSRGTNFTLKTIDCSGLIRGCMTITTIRIGAPDRLPWLRNYFFVAVCARKLHGVKKAGSAWIIAMEAFISSWHERGRGGCIFVSIFVLSLADLVILWRKRLPNEGKLGNSHNVKVKDKQRETKMHREN